MESHGMVLSGRSADNSLIEIIELADHPWYVASQFHPEFKSRPTRPHPLFRDFVGACVQQTREGQSQAYETLQEALGASSRGTQPDARVEM
jgi:CTP synthase